MGIRENVLRVREEVAEACARAGRAESSVELMAVSKMHPVSAIEEAYAAGMRLFGENKVQEFQGKAAIVRGLGRDAFTRPKEVGGDGATARGGADRFFASAMGEARVHLIGHLQSNKTAKAAELFDCVESVDSLKVGLRLSEAAVALGKVLPVLIEVKLSEEESKEGIAAEELLPMLEALRGAAGIVVRGLMTVPPWSEDAEVARPYFRRLRELRDSCTGFDLPELSMGMTNDFRVAIEEGSTCVRVGTAIFGKRLKAE